MEAPRTGHLSILTKRYIPRLAFAELNTSMTWKADSTASNWLKKAIAQRRPLRVLLTGHLGTSTRSLAALPPPSPPRSCIAGAKDVLVSFSSPAAAGNPAPSFRVAHCRASGTSHPRLRRQRWRPRRRPFRRQFICIRAAAGRVPIPKTERAPPDLADLVVTLLVST